MKESRIERISGEMASFTILDGSATRITDPTWIYHLKEGAGHYYGNIADLYAGFDGPNGPATQPWNYTTPVNTAPLKT